MATSSPTHEVDRDVVEAARLLSRAGVFSGVHASQLADMARHAVTRHLDAGDHLFRQGETGTSMYVLGRGRIRLYLDSSLDDGARGVSLRSGNGHDRRSGNGRSPEHRPDGQRTLADLEPPSAFGELAVFDGGPRSASAVALEPSMVVSLPGAVVRKAYRAAPDLADNLLRSLAALVRQATDQRSLLVFHDLSARVARLLLEDADSHVDGLAWVQAHPADLAARAGGSEAAVRRVLHEYEHAGLVRGHGAGLVIAQREVLERRAALDH